MKAERTNFDYRLLLARVKEKFGSCAEFGRRIDCSKSLISHRLCGKNGFPQKEILIWADALDIPIECIGRYFFTRKEQSGWQQRRNGK